MRPGLRVGSRAGPGATSSGPSAGGIGSSVLRTARRSAKAGFIEAVGVMVVVSHPARNASANQPMMSFMIKIETPAGLLSLAFLNRIWQGFVPLAPRLDGVSPYQCLIAKTSLVGRHSAEPQASATFVLIRSAQ